MHAFRILVLACLALSTTACATAVRGTTEPITFVSDPNGAKMTTTTGLACITPCTIEVPRKDTFTAKFELEGYETQSVFVDTVVADSAGATTAANVLLAPLLVAPVAVVVDVASGANLNHTPNPVTVKLLKLDEDGKPIPADPPKEGAVIAASGPEDPATGEKTPRPASSDESIPLDPTDDGKKNVTPAAAKTEPKELPFTCGASDIQWRDECQDEVGKSVNRPAKTDPDPGKKAEEAKEVPAYCKSRPNDAQYRDECRAAVVD